MPGMIVASCHGVPWAKASTISVFFFLQGTDIVDAKKNIPKSITES